MKQYYIWQGIHIITGEKSTGTSYAYSNEELKQQLLKQSIVIKKIKKRKISTIKNIFIPVDLKTLFLFTQQLHVMIQTKMTINQAFEILSTNITHRYLHYCVCQIHHNLQEGHTLYHSLSQFPDIFNTLYCHLIKTGEKNNQLEVILSYLLCYLEQKIQIKQKIKKACTYPTIIISFISIIIFCLLYFIVPQLKTIFENNNQNNLPYLTQYLLHTSEHLFFYITSLFIIMIILRFLYYLSYKNQSIQYYKEQLLLSLPFIGKIIHNIHIVQILRILSINLNAQISINDSLSLTINSCSNIYYQKKLILIQEQVIIGQSLYHALASTHLLIPTYLKMIQIGEKSNTLITFLEKIIQLYETQIDNTISLLLTLLEPILMLFVSIIVGTIMIAIYLPIFQIGSFL